MKNAEHKPVVVEYSHPRTPVGTLTVVEGPRGVLLIRLEKELPPAWRPEVERALGAAVRLRRVGRSRAAGQLAEYFAGTRRRFDCPVDLALVDGFRRRALQALREVPFGCVLSYGELARKMGAKRSAARAIGGAMRSNPIPIVVPCHRVVAADGSLGGFSGGLRVKRRLHRLEGIRALPGGWRSSERGRPPARRR